ncbi:MAG: acyltransferase [Anaerolineae bacterium]|nr:acyltransferase [Anaerolineae bacterium]
MTKLQDTVIATEFGHAKEQGLEKTALQAALTDSKKSALSKYQDVVIGSTSFFELLKFEFLTTVIGSLPGAAGLMLRKMLYKSMFGSIGRNVVIGRSVTIRHPRKIHLGDNVVIDDYAVLDAKGSTNQGIFIGDNVLIGRNSVISCKNGDIYIGDNTNIAMNCFVQSAKDVRIGKNILFAAYCYVIGGGDHMTDRIDIPILAQGQIVRGITIEDNCWLGAGVKVQDGASIGRDSIIGSGAVVTKDIPKFSIAVGIPAKVAKKRTAQ